MDYTGCGNTVNLAHPCVLRLVMDSLRYWVEMFHIDGFRFDLCSALGRDNGGFDAGSSFFDALRQDPLLSQVKLIAEPWDVGPGGYQLGGYPPGFAEWNDRFRDDVRKFWRGDNQMRATLATRLHGSGDHFDHHTRRPWASINFITAHDGFTLEDLVSYSTKYNLANGEDNRDGHSENLSSNWGAEGPTDDPVILARRALVKRSLLTTLLCANGVPMLLAGDEIGRTQQGNNNAYCQDNALSWLDWKLLDTPAGRELLAFVSRLIALRHAHPSLRTDRYVHGREELLPGIADVAWFDERGQTLSPQDWQDGSARRIVLRRAVRSAPDTIDLSLLMINASEWNAPYRLPPPLVPWRLAADAARPGLAAPPLGQPIEGDSMDVVAHGAALLVAEVASPTAVNGGASA